MKIILVGRGYWGSKLERVLLAAEHTLVDIVELPRDGAEALHDAGSKGAQAAVIATPAETHYALASAALHAGLDVLVEKPLTLSRQRSAELAAFAANQGKILAVDSTFVHTAVFGKLRLLRQVHGPVRRYQSLRLAPGPDHVTLAAGWDLIVHDVAILEALGELRQGSVVKALPGEYTASARFALSSGGVADCHASRRWPEKVRTTAIEFADGTMVTWIGERLLNKDGAELLHETIEPLRAMLDDFIRRCELRLLLGLTDGQHGVEVCGLLEEAFGAGG